MIPDGPTEDELIFALRLVAIFSALTVILTFAYAITL